jgi:hypothetical protein
MKRMNVNLKDNELMDLYIYEYNCFRITKSMPLTNVGSETYKYMYPDLLNYFSMEEIKDSYLFEENKPNSLLKETYNLSKRYIIAFTSKKYIKKFEKYGFRLMGLPKKHKIFGNDYCMRKDNDF